jgi:alkaline phosphatase D
LDHLEEIYISRLRFLKYSLAAGVVVWAGTGSAEARDLFRASKISPERFPQSVASGDPRPDGIVLWTRLKPPRGGGRVQVGYRIAPDDGRSDAEAFRNPLLSGTARTGPERDYTVKVQLQRPELRPFRKYRYRFYYDGAVSRTGRFKTLPAPNSDPGRLRFAYVSCQDYTNGYYNALGALARERVDFVVHLGDYIYETVAEESFQGGGPPERRIPPSAIGSGTPGEADTLKDYRFLYKKYKSDRNLQRVHENFAFIMTWDDHEFANDSFRFFAPDAAGEVRDPARRAAANRAWVEFNPVGVYYDPSKSPLEQIVIYRAFDFGRLATLVITDERLYRNGPPCGLETSRRYVTPGCGRERAPGRTMLGATQKEFFLNKITNSRSTWKIWGNEVQFMQTKVLNTFLGAARGILPDVHPSDLLDGIYLTLDQWDGYQAERAEIARRIRRAGVKNFVIITGDIHSFAAGYAKEDYDNPSNEPPNAVGVCFVGGSVTSSNLYEIARLGQSDTGPVVKNPAGLENALRASNPHYEFFNSSTHGYNLIEVTKQELICTMKYVETIREPLENPRTRVLARFRVPSGRVEVQRTDLSL